MTDKAPKPSNPACNILSLQHYATEIASYSTVSPAAQWKVEDNMILSRFPSYSVFLRTWLMPEKKETMWKGGLVCWLYMWFCISREEKWL